MQAFSITRPPSLTDALGAGGKDGTKYIAGGTDLLQLGKDNVEAPRRLIDLDGLVPATVAVAADGSLRIGAFARMAEVASHPDVRNGWPAISEALLLSASPQVRNMATVGGNLLQRTRCPYFRDTGFACNKRLPGSGCPAISGESRALGVAGVSAHCIATHPSDMPVALAAMDATLELQSPSGGTRIVPLLEFYRLPGVTPHIETNLVAGEIVTAIIVPASPSARTSRYVKVRDRAAFEFAVVSAAVSLDVSDGTVRQIRVACGGVAPKPWRLPEVEAALHGQPATERSFRAAADLAGQGTTPTTRNSFKVKLMQRAVMRGLQLAAA